jgi:hypothetical protein
MPSAWSGRRTETGERDRYEAMDRSLRPETTGGGDRVQAVGRQLFGGNIISDVASHDPIGDELADHLAKVALGARDLLVPVEKRRELGVVLPVRLLDDQCVRLEHS